MTDITKTNDRIWGMVGAAKHFGGPTYGIEPMAEAASCITAKLDGLLNSEFPGDNDKGLALLECDLNTLELGAEVAFRRAVHNFMVESSGEFGRLGAAGAETLAETDVLHKALDVARAINEQAAAERQARQAVENEAAQKRADERLSLDNLRRAKQLAEWPSKASWDIGLSGVKTNRGAVSFGDLPGGKMDHADIAENTKRSHAGDFEPKQYCPHDMLWTSPCAACGRAGLPETAGAKPGKWGVLKGLAALIKGGADELDDYGLKCGSCGAYHADEQPIGSRAWAKHVAQSAAYSRREFDMAPKALAEAERLENELASHGFASDGSSIIGAAEAGYERVATAPELADQDEPQVFYNADGTIDVVGSQTTIATKDLRKPFAEVAPDVFRKATEIAKDVADAAIERAGADTAKAMEPNPEWAQAFRPGDKDA